MSSSASATSIKYDFGLESPVPHFDHNASGDEINIHGSPDAFSKELSKLQEEQIHFGRKIEKEKARKEKLEADIEEASRNLRALQDRTKNGTFVRDHDMAHKKQIGRLEHHLQVSRIKLSVSRNENTTLKKRVQELRRDKLMNLQILNDLIKEASDAKKKLKYQQKELTHLNERKHKAKVAMTAIKNKMLKDMEEFSHELNLAKMNISTTQTNILSAMREKMLTTQLSPGKFGMQSPDAMSRTAAAAQENSSDLRADLMNQTDLQALLAEAGVTSAEDLITALEASEEQVFALYTETQMKEDEMERIDVDNKHLEHQVELQLSRLHALEGHHEEVKQELEKNIQTLRAQIAKYDADYVKNLEVLNGLSDHLLNLLKNVAQDEAAADQQLLSTGVNDRNVEEFLGLIEQRIDDLIQMSKAAQHQSIRRDDFLRIQPVDPKAAFHTPHLPSLNDAQDDEVEEHEEGAKLQPINIQVLKELMAKKVGRLPQGKPSKHAHHLGASGSGMRSRENSSRSIRSAGSHRSNKSN